MRKVPVENTNAYRFFYVDQDFKSKNSGAWLAIRVNSYNGNCNRSALGFSVGLTSL